MSDEKQRGMTVWFDCDVTQFDKNPLMFDTPFGKPVTIAKGNVFIERDDLEEALHSRFHADVDAAVAKAGIPVIR